MTKKIEFRTERRGDDTYWWEASVWVAVGYRLAITGTCKVWELDAQKAKATDRLAALVD